MKKSHVIFIFLFLGFLSAQAEIKDSVGTKVKNGKVFILHKMEAGQGLFGVSRQYGVPLAELVEANPGADKKLLVDQVIFVPTNRKPITIAKSKPKQEEIPDKDSKAIVVEKEEAPVITEKPEAKTVYAFSHDIRPEETLYSISKMYKCKVEDIMDLNNLEDGDKIEVGKTLLIPRLQNNSALISEKNAKEDELNREIEAMKNELPDREGMDETEEVKEERKIVANHGNMPIPYVINVEKIPELDVEKVEEEGKYALSSSEKLTQTKNVCLHHNAPVGTILMLTNPGNAKTVFVKVVGNFERESSSAIVVKITSNSAQHIGLKEKISSIKVSYAR